MFYFYFLGHQDGERAENGPKWQNILSVTPYILEIIHHMIFIYGSQVSFMVHKCKRIISPGIFFIFSKGQFPASSGGKRAKNGPKYQKILSVSVCISGTVHHMLVIFGTHEWNDISSKFFHYFKIFFDFLGSNKWPKTTNFTLSCWNWNLYMKFVHEDEICFLLALFNSFYKQFFFKFINKCKKNKKFWGVPHLLHIF